MRRHLRTQTKVITPIYHRVHFFLGVILVIFTIIIARLFYWQIIKHAELEAVAQAQYQRTYLQSGERGEIYFADGQPLVTNQEVYRLFAQPHLIPKEDIASLVRELTQLIITQIKTDQVAFNQDEEQKILESSLIQKLTKPRIKWVSLYQPINAETKTAIEALNYPYLGFDKYFQRYYPEASLAAQLVGFVGKNSQGEDVGYFGLEGGMHQELKPRSSEENLTADAKGIALESTVLEADQLDGRNVTTSIQRSIQYSLEKQLRQGIEKYGAKAGEIIVTDPKTGKILGMASWPNFDPRTFYQFDPEFYRNPSLSAAYEPGSTFKLLTVASALDARVITPNTTCPNCAGPRQFGQFTIKTWNDQYTPNITVTEALAKSDNVAMIYVAEALGAEKFREYLKNFGIGSPLGIDLQGDSGTPFKESWAPVELATVSFGQGIFTTSLQLVQAVGAIANNGEMMQLQILNHVDDPISQSSIEVEPKSIRQVISPETATLMKKMMVEAASQGEAQWTYQPDHTVAGKTGTSQVANPGGYDSTKTIASFIGFAPADQPKFLMLIKLIEPSTSPWAAETAAPLWYTVAEDLYLLLNIPPDKTP